MENNEYTIGNCIYCKKRKPLKNCVCSDCNDKVKMPEFFDKLFKNGGKDEIRKDK